MIISVKILSAKSDSKATASMRWEQSFFFFFLFLRKLKYCLVQSESPKVRLSFFRIIQQLHFPKQHTF